MSINEIKKKNYINFIHIIQLALQTLSNSNSIEPDVFVQSTVNRASQVLSDQFNKR